MLVTASHQEGQDVFVSFDKEALKQIVSVATHPLFSDEANWVMVSIVFKHNSSIKRLVSGFKGNFTKTDNVKVRPDMVGGEVYELHEILISGTNREPILSIKRADITNALLMDLTLNSDGSGNSGGGNSGGGSGGGITPTDASVAISSLSDPIVLGSFVVSVEFSESVASFISSDVSLTNCTISDFSGSGSSYSFSVTPTAVGAVSISIPAGVCSTSSGGINTASNVLSREMLTKPTCYISSLGPNVYDKFSVTVIFSEDVTGFTIEDAFVSNATVSNFSGSGSSYTFDVTPISQGGVTVQILAGAANGVYLLTNYPSNIISNQYYAPASVTLSSSSSTSVNGGFTVTATFSDAVAGFALSDLDLVNCTASSLESLSTSSFQFYLTPTSEGSVSAQVKSNAVQTFASGAGNTASNTLTRSYAPIIGWVGADNAVWSTASNWNPQSVPNSSVAYANISRTISGTAAATLLVDSDVTVNKLQFSSSNTQWTLSNSNSKSLTFGGVSPTLESSQSNTKIQAPSVIDGDLTIKGNSNYYFGYNSSSFGKITANNKNIVIEPSVASVTFSYNNLNTFVGGTLTFSQALFANVNSYDSHFGGVNGPKIIYKNDSLSPTYGTATNSGVLRSVTALPNSVEFSDVGSYNFKVDTRMTGTLTGTISKILYLQHVQGGAGITGDISGLSFTGNGKIVVRKGTEANFPSAPMNGGEISLCDSTDSNTLQLNYFTTAYYGSSGTIPHTIKVRGSCTNRLYLGNSSGNFTGSIVMNPEGTVAAGSLFDIYGNGTVSGSITNGASNAQNMTLRFNIYSSVALPNTYTYTSPTSVDGGSLMVYGSIANSAVTITSNSNGNFFLTGTCGSLTNTNGALYMCTNGGTPTATSFGTVNGNFSNSGRFLPRFSSLNTDSNKLVVNGNVTLGGTIGYATIGPVSGRTYTVLEYTGTRTGTFATNSLPSGTTITYDDANKRVLVTRP